ncbi:MAG: S46 family peptidase [Bacteroidales bacterium]|nr:MAG: S46 family peptidase [Bacteroidales bacterium]
MKRYILPGLTFLFLYFNNLAANEGMWLLPLMGKINIAVMNEMGLKLTAEDIYSIKNSSMKDAIVFFGEGCTGEIISDRGLILTNHHCGMSQIQEHSTVDNDLLKDGFWAFNESEELPNPDLTVKFLISIEDVSERINSELSDTMTEFKRKEIISIISEEIEEEATEDTYYQAQVKSLFEGNNFYLFIYEVFKDVRLVGAPPSSIGKFGHDTDNWMWPRHTGDFCLFRVYTDPDGNPAEYSEDNIPYKPKYYLPISIKGISSGDFAMILGYPGRTYRYITSYEIKELLEITHPNRIKIRNIRQQILLEDMMESEKVNIQYNAKYFKSSNYWKFSIGQSQGLKRLKIYDKKKELEKRFTEWVSQDNERQKKYGNTLELIKNAINERKTLQHTNQYILEAFFRSSEILSFANKTNWLYSAIPKNNYNKEIINTLTQDLKEDGDDHFINYNPPTDKDVTLAMIKLYKNNVPEEQAPEFYETIESNYNGNYEKFVRLMFRKSIFADQDRYNEFIQNPSIKVLKKDPAFATVKSIYSKYLENRNKLREININLNRGRRLYMAGLMEMQKDKIFYPDANSTMRITYGTVGDYSPRDAVHYDYYTSLEGVMEKEDPDNWEFAVPSKLKELYEKKDYSNYGVDGKMNVCFITDNDITGGNSGSPVINDKGQIIGLAFDGNWEAMSGDIIYEPELQKCICVDIRYVLFIIDKYAGATNIINELKILN